MGEISLKDVAHDVESPGAFIEDTKVTELSGDRGVPIGVFAC
jgi:hypothetical protein